MERVTLSLEQDVEAARIQLTCETKAARSIIVPRLTAEEAQFVAIYSKPILLASNAFVGNQTSASGTILDPSAFIAAHRPPDVRPTEKLGDSGGIDLDDWTSNEVGWGLIVAQGVCVPDCLVRLTKARKGREFRYRREAPVAGRQFLYDPMYDASPALVNADIGLGQGCIPRFLLIYGTPDEIPWSFQYQLNMNRAVGRLHLEGAALENYVNHAISGWSESKLNPRSSVVWGTRYSATDFTASSLRAIAKPLADALSAYGACAEQLLRKDATCEKLRDSLNRLKPSLIVTASHGSTAPLDDLERLKASLGFPIDQSFTALDPDDLLKAWNPDGAIWYAHACCSAGSDRNSVFAGLFEDDSSLAAVLTGLTAIGSTIAPLPTRLLSAPEPLRAFIGHVEPTFDWTLRDPDSNAAISRPYLDSLATNAFQERKPIGSALLGKLFANIAARFSAYDLAMQSPRLDAEVTITDILVARDIQRTVLLGDPTVALPPPLTGDLPGLQKG